MTTVTDERIKRLPMWAQQHIASLTSSVERLQGDLVRARRDTDERAEGMTPIWVSGLDAEHLHLDKDDQITYAMKGSRYPKFTMQVLLAPDATYLDVSGLSGISVVPTSGNRVHIFPRE